MNGLKTFLALTCACALLSGPARAQSAADLARIEKEMADQKSAAAKLEKKEQATASELEQLRDKLVAASDAMEKKQDEQENLEDRLESLVLETQQRSQALAASRQRLASLTGGLVQLSREPPALLAMRETSADDQVHRSVLLRALLPRLKAETNQIIQELEAYEALQSKTQAQRKLVVAARQNLQWQSHNLDQLVKTRQGLLEKTQGEKEHIARQLAALGNEAKDLRELLDKVSQPGWGAGKGATGKTPPLRAGLRNPVAGKVVRLFGAKDDFGVASNGMTFAAAVGSPVLAPQSGRVVFAGPFKGYGKVIILQHTGGTHSFLSGLGRIDADMGQTVAAGEPLGAMPNEGKTDLYFEWRQNGEARDPTTQGLTLRSKSK